MNLTAEQRQTVLSLLERHLPGVAAWAYGSRATGTSRPESDLDLVVFASPDQRGHVDDLRDAFEESDLPFRVDLFVWDEVPSEFHQQIERQRVRLPGANDPHLLKRNWVKTKPDSGDQRAPFGDCAATVRDLVNPTDVDGATPYVGLKNIGEGTLTLLDVGTAEDATSTKTQFRSGDILFGKLRPYFRKVIRPRFDGICSTDIWVVRPRGRVDAGYLFYVMASPEFVAAASRGSDGTRMPRANWQDVAQLEVRVPPLVEQRSIADVLGALDDKIELDRRMSETLEAMALAIFKDWFVDFGPTRAKMEGRASYLPPDIWNLFPATLDSDGKPAGWEERSLGDLFDVSIGRTPPRKETRHFVANGQGETWLSIKSMKDVQTFAFSSEEDLTLDAISLYRVPKIPSGTVVVSFKLTVGRVAITARDMYSNEAIAHLVADESVGISNTYTYCFMKTFDYRTLASTSSIATAVNSKTIKGIKMLVPDREVHDAFARQMRPVFDHILSNGQGGMALVALRERLLPELVSGGLRLSDA